MSQNIVMENIETISAELKENVGKVKYGMAGVALRIHDGRVVDVTYTVTVNTREQVAINNKGCKL